MAAGLDPFDSAKVLNTTPPCRARHNDCFWCAALSRREGGLDALEMEQYSVDDDMNDTAGQQLCPATMYHGLVPVLLYKIAGIHFDKISPYNYEFRFDPGLPVYAGYGQYCGIGGDNDLVPPHTDPDGETSSTTGNAPSRLIGLAVQGLDDCPRGELWFVFVAELAAPLFICGAFLAASFVCIFSASIIGGIVQSAVTQK